jgi:DNA-directed RNA polymerase
MNLSTVRQNEIPEVPAVFAEKELIKRELALEEESIEWSIRNYREKLHPTQKKPNGKDKTPTSLSDLPPGIALTQKAIEPFVKAIKKFKEYANNGGRLKDTRKFLNEFQDEELAFIAARRIIMSIGQSDPEPVQRVAISIARMLKDHLEYKKFKETPNKQGLTDKDGNVKTYAGYVYTIEKNKKTASAEHRRTVLKHARHKLGIPDENWTATDQVHIGVKLVDLFVESTGLVERVQKSSTYKEGRFYYLRPTEELEKRLREAHLRCEVLNPLLMPMIVEPIPWETVTGGGFLTNQTTHKHPLIKNRDRRVLLRLLDVPMPEVYRAVNNLQKTAWKINTKVYEVMKELWESNSCLAGLPLFEEEPLPIKPWGEDLSKSEFNLYKKENPSIVAEWKHRATQVYDRRARARSKRASMAIKMHLADKFKNESSIYFCWQLDWRGRLYPMQPFLNPQSDDTGKALLQFAKGKPLGPHGVYWLKVHLANEMGKDPITGVSLDKLPFEERVKWVDEHEKYILDSAYYALDGSRYWTYAESPFSFLAGCFEYLGYKQQGEGFISHIPISLDGSCNGLQNFSALLHDYEGGKATNLVPGSSPADVYGEVLKKVKAQVETYAAQGHTTAKAWSGKLDRKLVKRGTMTYVYGAKEFGMKDQLMSELAKRDTATSKYLADEDNLEACMFLGKILYQSIGDVVVAAKNAMDWLQKVAKICSKEKIPIKWTTPIGFEVVQEYKQSLTKRIETFWGGIRIPLSIKVDIDKLNTQKQVNAISPNVIHSLDSSHLMLTINEVYDSGIDSFSAVHDSFGTHACDVPVLAKVLRETFIRQYSGDFLAQFRDNVMAQLPEKAAKEIPPLPQKGNLDLNVIRDSAYFFA